jgi:uncharacterized membrane protein YgcG
MTGMTTTSENGCKSPQVITLETAQPGVAMKSGVTKKRVILAASSVLVAAIVIVGILIGVKFYLDATNDVVTRTLQFSTESLERVTQTMTSYPSESVVAYHVAEKDADYWYIDDFNRDIRIMKARTPTGYACFVTPLNSSTGTMQDVQNVTEPTGPVQTVYTHVRVSPNPIKDKTMLGPKGMSMCSAENVHWVMPFCENDATSPATGSSTGAASSRGQPRGRGFSGTGSSGAQGSTGATGDITITITVTCPPGTCGMTVYRSLRATGIRVKTRAKNRGRTRISSVEEKRNETTTVGKSSRREKMTSERIGRGSLSSLE